MAQAPTRVTAYDPGTVVDYCRGACGQAVPGTEGLATYCDESFVYTSVVPSPELPGGAEVIIRTADNFTSITDRTPGKLSARLTDKFVSAHPTQDGGMRLVDRIGSVAFVNPDGQFADLGLLSGSPQAAVDGEGILVYPRTSNRSLQRATFPRPTDVAASSRQPRVLTGFGEEVWAVNGAGTAVEVIVEGQGIHESPISPDIEADRAFFGTAGRDSDLWLYSYSRDSVRLRGRSEAEGFV